MMKRITLLSAAGFVALVVACNGATQGERPSTVGEERSSTSSGSGPAAPTEELGAKSKVSRGGAVVLEDGARAELSNWSALLEIREELGETDSAELSIQVTDASNVDRVTLTLQLPRVQPRGFSLLGEYELSRDVSIGLRRGETEVFAESGTLVIESHEMGRLSGSAHVLVDGKAIDIQFTGNLGVSCSVLDSPDVADLRANDGGKQDDPALLTHRVVNVEDEFCSQYL